MSQFFTWGGQSIGVSALPSVLPINTQDWSLEWTDWTSLQSRGLSRVFSNTTVQKHQFFSTQLSSQSNSSKHLLISWLQSPSAVIVEPKKMKPANLTTVSPSICHEVMGPDAMILVFWMFSFKPTFSLSSFTVIKRLFSSCLLSAIQVVSPAYLRLLIFLLAFLIPACASSSPAFLVMYSAYKLNKQGDNIQPWHTSFPIWNQCFVHVQF